MFLSPGIFAGSSAQAEIAFYAVLNELTNLPTVDKAKFAISKNQQLLYSTSKISEVLRVMTPENQHEFLLASANKLTAPGALTYALSVLPSDKRPQLVAAAEKQITPDNIAKVATCLYPDAKDRLAFINKHLKQVDTKSYVEVIACLHVDDQLKFLNDHQKLIHNSNLHEVSAFIPTNNLADFLINTAKCLHTSNILYLIAKVPIEDRNRLLHTAAFTGSVNGFTITKLIELLPQKDRMMAIQTYHAALTPRNFVAILKLLTNPEERNVIIANNPNVVIADNLADVVSMLPQNLQLIFLEAGMKQLFPEKNYAEWVKCAGSLTDLNERYKFISARLDQLVTKEDVFTAIWIMEILSGEHALLVAKGYLPNIKSTEDFINLFQCKSLTLPGKASLIESYLPLIRDNKTEAVFKIRASFVKLLTAATGKAYLRGDLSDLAALNIVLAAMQIEKPAQHDARLFGNTVTIQPQVLADQTSANANQMRIG